MEKDKKHFQKEFEVAGVKLRVKKLGLAEFPAFKTIYGNAINNSDAEGTIKAYYMLFGWLQHEIMGEWIPVWNSVNEEFVIEKLNDPVNADTIINILITKVLEPLFQNTVESMK